MKQIKTNKAPQAIGLYFQGVRTGGFVFTSGQMPAGPAGGAKAEAK